MMVLRSICTPESATRFATAMRESRRCGLLLKEGKITPEENRRRIDVLMQWGGPLREKDAGTQPDWFGEDVKPETAVMEVPKPMSDVEAYQRQQDLGEQIDRIEER